MLDADTGETHVKTYEGVAGTVPERRRRVVDEPLRCGDLGEGELFESPLKAFDVGDLEVIEILDCLGQARAVNPVVRKTVDVVC